MVALSVLPGAAPAQMKTAPHWLDPASPRVAAFTVCAEGRPVTFVNATVVETDSLAEILAHERRHQQQLLSRRLCWAAADSVQLESLDQLLGDEMDAYCASLPYAERRGIPRAERIGQYAGRLFQQFGGAVSVGVIVARLSRSCALLRSPRR